MATGASIGYGASLAVGDGGSPEVFTALGELTNLTPPAPVRETHDATHMASPNRIREFIGGLIDAGEASADLNYVPGGATEILLNACLQQVTPRNYRITYANTEVHNFPGLLTTRAPSVPLDDIMSISVSIKVSGEPEFLSIS